MSKKKRKLKRLLKGAALAGAAALGASALNRRRQNQEFLATEGGDISILPKKKRFVNVDGRLAFPIDYNANPREIANKVADYGFDTNKPNMGMPKPSNKTLAGNYGDAFSYMPMKDGGKVVKTGEEPKKRKKKIGIQIRGFGKARKN